LILRTGSVGNRTVEDMVRTLPEPKKQVISSLRERLLRLGYSEEVEYDPINVEPVMIYSKSEKDVVYVRHKWETTASILLVDPHKSGEIENDPKKSLLNFIAVDDQGNQMLRFPLPEYEAEVFHILEERLKDGSASAGK